MTFNNKNIETDYAHQNNVERKEKLAASKPDILFAPFYFSFSYHEKYGRESAGLSGKIFSKYRPSHCP